MPGLTVVVPLYNKQATVRRALDSIASQSMDNFEAVVVNDGSTDGSADEVERFLESTGDTRFRLVHQKNLGPGAARNRGLGEAQGEVVAFLDADDEWLPGYLELAAGGLTREAEAAATCMGWLDMPGKKSVLPRMAAAGIRPGLLRLHSRTPVARLVNLMVLMWPCTTVVRREMALRYGGFREDHCLYAEDVHLWLKIVLNHPVLVQWSEGALFHRTASNLSGNYRGMRPVEPFLEDPEDVRRYCPEEIRTLLEEFLAIRAMKTACVMSYWGHWRPAKELRGRFQPRSRWRLDWYWTSWLASNPAASLAAQLWRSVR